MRLKIITLLTVMLLSLPMAMKANIAGTWRLHPAFDAYISNVIDTPDNVYFLVLGQRQYDKSEDYRLPQPYLFVYDKEGDEMLAYNSMNYLSENQPLSVHYNPDRKYLLLIYNNYNIDILEENGDVHNIPALKASNLASSKKVNGVTFDSEKNHIYLATDFGYLVIDDKKHNVAESHIYNKPINSIGRIGDNIIALTATGALYSPVNEKRNTYDAFKPLNLSVSNPTVLMPLDGNKFACLSGRILYEVELKGGDKAEANELKRSVGTTVSHNKKGYVLSGTGSLFTLEKNGTLNSITLPTEDQNRIVGTWDGSEFWIGEPRKGLASRKLNDKTWTTTRDYIRPNAPSTCISEYMAYNDKYGVISVNHGVKRPFISNALSYPNLLCGYKDGEWTPYSPVYSDSKYEVVGLLPSGLAIDPDDPKYVYSGSYYGGVVRYNLEDPTDLLIMSHPSDKAAKLPGYVQLVPDNTGWAEYCNFTTPGFDGDGNLWTALTSDPMPGDAKKVWVWPADKRRAGDVSGWINFDVGNFPGGVFQFIKPLQHQRNKNIVIMQSGNWDDALYILDHKGTLNNTADDKVVTMQTILDQDGTRVTKNYIFNIIEDPNTGFVWVCTFNGIFYFNPANVIAGNTAVTRIKVPRNDGTNLADYLLDNVGVFNMCIDGQNRKWFCTNGGGLICTSADGRQVLAEFTADNSPLPSSDVYGVVYNPESNSIIASTGAGYAEFFPAGSVGGDDFSSVRVYPNPVRPDFLGWVTIDGLVDGSLVKIVDGSGNVVKELGLANGGEVQWDVTDTTFNRVLSGVYYVVSSTGPGNLDLAKTTKILVIN